MLQFVKSVFGNYGLQMIAFVMICSGIYTGTTGKQSWTESAVIICLGGGILFHRYRNLFKVNPPDDTPSNNEPTKPE